MNIVVSNNPKVKDYRDIAYYLKDQDYLDVLIKARDLIHQNYHLLTHPLSSNFLPDKTLYKTVVLKKESTFDLHSLDIIENAIILSRNSLVHRDKRIFEASILEDLQYVDYEIIKNTL